MPINSLIPQVVFNNKVSYISMYVLMQPTYTYVKYTKNDKKPNMQHELALRKVYRYITKAKKLMLFNTKQNSLIWLGSLHQNTIQNMGLGRSFRASRRYYAMCSIEDRFMETRRKKC